MAHVEGGKQIALWAYKLKFEHPVTKEVLEFIDAPEKVGSWKILEDMQINS